MTFKDVVRSNTKYFVPVQLSMTALVVYYCVLHSIPAVWWSLGIISYFCTGCLGITVTFHRYLAHKTFRMPLWMEYLFTLFGSLGGTGSSIGWVGVHRQHHSKSDLPEDPHSPKILGWRTFFPAYSFTLNKWALRDLITNPFHIFLHEYYFAILATWGLVVLLSAGAIGFVFLFALPISLQIWISVLSNFGNHQRTWGYQNFDTNDDSINSWWLALLTWGEGWHNNHHRYPGRYTFQYKWWELDITGLIIKLVRRPSLHRKKVAGDSAQNFFDHNLEV